MSVRGASAWDRDDLPMNEIEATLGAQHVRDIVAMPQAECHCLSRAHGWWVANDRERRVACLSLARAVRTGKMLQ